MEFKLSPAMKTLMNKSRWFGKIIYSPNLEILENNWKECQKLETEFQDLQYHREYYELVSKKLKRLSRINKSRKSRKSKKL